MINFKVLQEFTCYNKEGSKQIWKLIDFEDTGVIEITCNGNVSYQTNIKSMAEERFYKLIKDKLIF